MYSIYRYGAGSDTAAERAFHASVLSRRFCMHPSCTSPFTLDRSGHANNLATNTVRYGMLMRFCKNCTVHPFYLCTWSTVGYYIYIYMVSGTVCIVTTTIKSLYNCIYGRDEHEPKKSGSAQLEIVI